MADLNRYSPALFEPTIVPEQSTFGEAVGATLGLRFAPVAESALIGMRFAGEETDPNFNWKESLGDHALYATSLYGAKNAQHMAALKSMIDRSSERRRVMSNSTMMTQLGAGLLDPINFIALPLGGPAVGVARSALRVGVGTAVVEGAAEAVNLQLDPVKTIEEATINTASAALFGGALGGAISIPISRRAVALERTNQANAEMFQMATRIENLSGMTPEQIRNAPAREEREFGGADDAELRTTIRTYEADAESLVAKGDMQAANDLRSRSQSLRNEIGLRQLDEIDVDLNDPYSIKSSWFTDSALFKMVSTPMKRTLQGNYPSAVKEIFLKGFGDGGITVALNSIGLPTPQSVAVRTATHAGRWVRAHDDLVKLWASETGASTASRLDLNMSDIARRASRSDDTYRKWLTNVSDKRIRGVEDMTENELKASSIITKYFEDAEVRLEEVGLLNSDKGMSRQIEMLEAEIKNLKSSLTGVKAKSLEREMVNGRIKRLEDQANSLDAIRREPRGTAEKEPFFARFFDKGSIRSRRKEFGAILYDWFEKNPSVYRMDESGQPIKVELSTSPDKIRERVEETIKGILGENDPLGLDTVSFGMGRSKHFRSRQLDIPNKLVADFMVRDPLAVMKTYAARIEPRYEFAKQFGKDLEGVRFDVQRSMIAAGKSQVEINKVMRDFNHMYDRTIGTVLENPDALSQKAAFVLREAASFSYMGSSGIAAIPDFGRIVMEYDMDNVWKGVQATLDKERINMTVNEVRLAGEAIDILKGSAHMRLMEDMSNNIDASDILSQTRNAFYILNGLAPLTTLAKQLAGVIDAHQIIDYSIKLGQGKLDDQAIEWLARYGIGKDMAEKIARAPFEKTENGFYMANTDQWADSIFIPEIDGKQVRVIEANADGSSVGKSRNGRYIPAFYNDTTKTINFDRDYIEGPMFDSKSWLDPKMEGVNALPDIFKTPKQWSNFVMLHEINHSRFRREDLGFNDKQTAEYENAINDLALKDYREAQTINEETVTQFRAALNSGVLNTIMSGTPADKPIITDGVVYIPMSVASKFGMKEHPKFKGYARIENGLMGLPFQFYSFVFANVNKTVGALAQGQIKNRAIGSATMMGLAYMSLQLRTPDYVWNDMSAQDKFARTFDMSGIMALYSDIFYTSMHTSLALGGPNITNGILSPKFNQQQSVADAITGIAGAGPSWGYDMGSSMVNFASGDYAEGGKDIVRNLPFARMWFWKDEVNQITNAWAN